VRVYIQNEAGSRTKHYHNEKTLQFKRKAQVSRPYPFPYGFVLDTTAADVCNVDCFVLTRRPLHAGEIVDCEPVALTEQFEDGQEDHNVLAVMTGEQAPLGEAVKQQLTEFVSHVFDHVSGKKIAVGNFRSSEDALNYLAEHDGTKMGHIEIRAKSHSIRADLGENSPKKGLARNHKQNLASSSPAGFRRSGPLFPGDLVRSVAGFHARASRGRARR
jgi:inorganic pyrophosphatase